MSNLQLSLTLTAKSNQGNGGNWPSKTGGKSGGGRGNAPSRK